MDRHRIRLHQTDSWRVEDGYKVLWKIGLLLGDTRRRDYRVHQCGGDRASLEAWLDQQTITN
jgi:hypothetical protein